MPDTDAAGFARQLGMSGLAQQYLQDPQQAWVSSHDHAEPQTGFGILYDRLAANTLVVGFELPPTMRRALSARGHRYVSVHIHPLRFLPDLLFGVYSNCPDLARLLSAHAFDPETVDQQVARMAARFARQDLVHSRLPPGCPLLIGQTRQDASLIAGGRFQNWADHGDALARLLHGHDTVAYIRHPHAAWPDDDLALVRDDLGKTVIAMTHNAYPVIMAGRLLGPVISLSSSVGVEAEAFGHAVHFLIADPRRKFLTAGVDHDEQVMIGHDFLTIGFWEKALCRSDNDAAKPKSPFCFGVDHVRSTLEAWSFTGLTGNERLPHATKILMPARNLERAAIDRLLADLVQPSARQELDRPGMLAAAEAGGATVRCLPPALASGQTWRWDRASEVLGLPGQDGLGSTEGDGAWFDGSECRIVLLLKRGATDEQTLSGELRLSFFRGLLDRYPVLLLRANGEPIAAVLHRGGDDPYVRLPFTVRLPAGATCTLTLSCSHSDQPAALGLGSDTRRLGILLHAMAATVDDAHKAGQTNDLTLWGFGADPLCLPAELNWSSDG
jgi:hypothetical protein